ncbi:carbohydrate ABC transporter permease [Roseisalinus antarcticus]|uniref:L-arabinose transport system permease protein AraQ n=1 Tax=Roseisalinus antarcticus TaxID=254357 RepID=A0A1Y5TZE6_9RHOB|nr:carbohydrate ABC transporter permease [Roseisalinus antarcticus]SLN77501.1 L-arabinose transport system permease protein AraQ [Roseisalinus antarcticus]
MKFRDFPMPVRIAAYALLLVMLVSVLLPFVWMVFTAFKSLEEYAVNPLGVPQDWQFGNIAEAWEIGNFLRLYANSLFVTIVSVSGLLLTCSMAGYAFAHFDFRGRDLLFFYFLAGMMIPPQVILIPAFKVMSELGLVNTYFAVILTYLAWVPFAIFFFRAYFRGIPRDLSEAARIDGASEFAIFFRIMLPLAAPAMTTVGIVYFVWIFNDFMWPLVYLNNTGLRTVTLGMMNFQGQYSGATTLKTAALLLATMPPVIVFIVFRKRIQGGLAEGALKG